MWALDACQYHYIDMWDLDACQYHYTDMWDHGACQYPGRGVIFWCLPVFLQKHLGSWCLPENCGILVPASTPTETWGLDECQRFYRDWGSWCWPVPQQKHKILMPASIPTDISDLGSLCLPVPYSNMWDLVPASTATELCMILVPPSRHETSQFNKLVSAGSLIISTSGGVSDFHFGETER